MPTIKSMVWIAVIRTVVAGIIGKLLDSAIGMQIATFLADFGIPLPLDIIIETVSVFFLGLVIFITNWLGPKFAIINKIMSLGLSRTGPAYVPNNADAVTNVAVAGGNDRTVVVDVPPPGPNE